ncbi:PA14 domain-containing protein [Hymenobacter arizonensis]|nr:PA14 domain-containing protein [Hymenobacter arizonensis]
MAQTSASCSGAGSATYQVWANVNGSAVGDIPTGSAPSSTAAIASFEAPAQSGFNYGARVRAYLCPPTSGAYTFWVVGDDAAELFLSTSDDPAKKVRIASCAGWTSGNRDFTRMASQQSAPVQLTAGTRYYVEALHKQSWGPGYLAVAWRLPNGTRQEPIPGANLLPFASTASLTSSATGSSATVAAAEAGTTASVYPNPVAGQGGRATVAFRLAQAGPVTLALYNLQGQRLRQLLADTRPAGELQHVPFDTNGLPDGVFFVRLITQHEVINTRFTITR